MEPEQTMQSAPLVDPSPPTSQPQFTPKSKAKLLPIIGGVAVILFSIALGIVFFGNSSSQSGSSDQSSSSTSEEQLSTWPAYTNADYFYTLSLPPRWSEIKRSPLYSDNALFNADNLATLEINAFKNTVTLDEYLGALDEKNKELLKPTKTTQVKVGEYDGYERQESWPKTGLQGVSTYIKVSDMFYIFTLSPTGDKNVIGSEAIIRDYHASLSSFHLTDTSQLGQDLKHYTSQKIGTLAFQSFSLEYPQTWALVDKVGQNSLDVSIYRNNYELTISQKAIGGAVCLFSDSPAFEGSSGDLRNKQYAEFNTASGAILRRYFNANQGDKSSMFFCEKQKDGPYFQTPLTIGGLVYNVPAKYDADIIKEMDEIVKSITPQDSTASALSQWNSNSCC